MEPMDGTVSMDMVEEMPDPTGKDISADIQEPEQTQEVKTPEVVKNPRPTDKELFDAIDDDKLNAYILQKLENDISDREASGWQEKREYDYKAYYGLTKKTNFPWKNASNFPVPLTPTLVDTAQANIMASIFSDPRNTTEVEGVGPEDVRTAVLLKQLINWQIYSEIDLYNTFDKLSMNALRSSIGIAKVLHDPFTNKIDVTVVPYSRLYMSLDSRGFQKYDTDHVIELIEWNDADMENHKNLGLFKNLDSISKGMRIRQSSTEQVITTDMDLISGQNLEQKKSRDNYFIGEAYLTYFVEYGDDVEGKGKNKYPVEIVVWFGPNGGGILHKALNEINRRPYACAIPFPFDDRFGGMSLPEKIRPIQEELNYAHNQNINAADLAISPPLFKEGGTNFPNEAYERVPGGTYDVDNVQGLHFQPTESVNPIFERQEDRYWDLAERLTGLTELFQGRQAQGKQTATATIRRENKSEIRFKSIYQRFEKCWGEIIELIFIYDSKYMPKDKKIQILGYQDYKSIKEIFPEGISGQYNFTFHSDPVTEKDYKKKNIKEWRDAVMVSPLVQSDRSALWKIDKFYSESLGVKDFAMMVSPPPEVSIISADEAIGKLMSGDVTIMPDVNVNPEEQIIKFAFFMKGDTFKGQELQVQQAIALYARRLDQIRIGQLKAKMQVNQSKQQSRGGQEQAPKEEQPQSGQPQPQGVKQNG